MLHRHQHVKLEKLKPSPETTFTCGRVGRCLVPVHVARYATSRRVMGSCQLPLFRSDTCSYLTFPPVASVLVSIDVGFLRKAVMVNPVFTNSNRKGRIVFFFFDSVLSLIFGSVLNSNNSVSSLHREGRTRPWKL